MKVWSAAVFYTCSLNKRRVKMCGQIVRGKDDIANMSKMYFFNIQELQYVVQLISSSFSMKSLLLSY